MHHGAQTPHPADPKLAQGCAILHRSTYACGMADKERELNWEDIRYFLASAEEGSLSGAARSLGVEHTTVGRRLTSLEQAMGAALVLRTPAGLELTRLGQRVLRQAKDMRRAAEGMAAHALGERTNVRLVVPTGFTILLTSRLSALMASEPGLALDIVSGSRRVDLRKGEADLAIRVGPVQDEALVVRKLGEVGSALYASRAYLARHKIAPDPEHLIGHALIGFHRSLAAMPAAVWLEERARGARIVMRSREAADMLTAVQQGVGLAVLPCFLAETDSQLVRLTSKVVGTRRVSLVFRRDRRLSPELRAVIRFIIDTISPSLGVR